MTVGQKALGKSFLVLKSMQMNRFFSSSSAGDVWSFCSHERWRDFSEDRTADTLRIQSRK